jgi:hypothetical protein
VRNGCCPPLEDDFAVCVISNSSSLPEVNCIVFVNILAITSCVDLIRVIYLFNSDCDKYVVFFFLLFNLILMGTIRCVCVCTT